MDDEFNLFVLPSNQSDQFPIYESEFVVGFHADITLLTASDDHDDDARDFECTTQQRFLYDKDLKLGREDWRDEKVCRAALVNALTEMDVLPEEYYEEIVNGVLTFVKGEGFSRCGVVSVDVQLVKYADCEDEKDADEMETDRIEPSFALVFADEKMRESENCVICLGGFEVGVGVYRLKCQHVFHIKCLLDWLDKSVTCPLCRKQPPNFFVSPALDSV